MARNALEQAAVEAIMASQASRQRRLKAADLVIFNDGISLALLKQHVQVLAVNFGLSLVHNTDPSKLA